MSEIKVSTFDNTNKSDKFKVFLNTKFNINMLDPKSDDILFDGWRNRGNLNGWSKFINENGHCLEFYPTYYSIKVGNDNAYMIPIPDTINNFINDMDRYGIQLYWNNVIDIKFEPNEYLKISEIKDYWVKLLNKMEKGHELL